MRICLHTCAQHRSAQSDLCHEKGCFGIPCPSLRGPGRSRDAHHSGNAGRCGFLSSCSACLDKTKRRLKERLHLFARPGACDALQALLATYVFLIFGDTDHETAPPLSPATWPVLQDIDRKRLLSVFAWALRNSWESSRRVLTSAGHSLRRPIPKRAA